MNDHGFAKNNAIDICTRVDYTITIVMLNRLRRVISDDWPQWETNCCLPITYLGCGMWIMDALTLGYELFRE